MELSRLLETFLSVSIGEERVLESYAEVMVTIEAKRRLLSGPMPFTLRDEIELHKRLVAYADSCIALISTLQKQLNLQRLDFPLHHDLLRKFRDRNHHVGYRPFVPYRSRDGSDFYVWPVLCQVEAIKQTYKVWCSTPSKLTLAELLAENQSFVVDLIEKQKGKFTANGLEPRFRETYHLGEIHFGSVEEPPTSEG